MAPFGLAQLPVGRPSADDHLARPHRPDHAPRPGERDLGEHVERFGIANATHYTTGLPIWSLEKPAAGADFAWVWHPDPAHPSNAPRILDADADLGNGERGTIVISSPGRIDVVRHKV